MQFKLRCFFHNQERNCNFAKMNKFFWILTIFVCELYGQVDPSRIDIVRDAWGVPHIYAKTDAEVAYGLAWAHCEDDFFTLQYQLIRYKGRMGEFEGVSGAISDYFYHYIRTAQTVEKDYHLLSKDYLAFLNGYVQGINDYAKKHPKKVIMKNLFPVTDKDVLSGYVMTTAAMVGLPFAMQYILKGKADDYLFSPGRRIAEHKDAWKQHFERYYTLASNAIAVRHTATSDQKNHIVINPHIGLDDYVNWYEVHMKSEEGLNIIGALFPGATSPGLGATPHHAWAMTFNWPDYVDIYRMELNPKNKNQYLFDGKYLDFERKKVTLKIKTPLGIKISVKKEVLWSVYGPAYRTKDGKVYATAFASNHTTKAGEEWYRLAKAQSFEQFQEALKMGNIPLFNIVYADKENILYFFNAALPKRNPNYDWQKSLPGNTSETLWGDYLSFEALPKVINPACGFVYNTNNSPFYATCEGSNCDSKTFDKVHAWNWNRQNNRALRLEQLLQQTSIFNREVLKQIKYDCQYPLNGGIAKTFQRLLTIDANAYPDIKDALELFKTWDYRADTTNRVCALISLTFHHVFEQTGSGYVELETGISPSEKLLVESVRWAKKWFLKYYKRIDPEFGQVQRLRRVGASAHYAISGMPEMLSPIISTPQKEGYLLPINGDTYIQFVTYGKEGIENLETIVPMGASRDKNSPHYTDQMPLFAQRKLKSMTFSKEQILQTATKVYSPQ